MAWNLGLLGAAGGGVEVPAFLDSAPLWLDAADASTITESGGSVSQWDNKGTLDNFVQSTSSDQPTTGVSTKNDLNLIDFNGNLMQQAGSIGSFNFLHDGTDFFIATVTKFIDNGGKQGYISSCSPTNNDVGFDFQNKFNESPVETGFNVRRGGTGPAWKIVDDSLYTLTDFNIISILADTNNATASERVNYFENNTQGSETNSSTLSPSSGNSSNKMTIGARGTEQFTMQGSIGEMIVVSGADATEENRQIVVDYLNAKWGVF